MLQGVENARPPGSTATPRICARRFAAARFVLQANAKEVPAAVLAQRPRNESILGAYLWSTAIARSSSFGETCFHEDILVLPEFRVEPQTKYDRRLTCSSVSCETLDSTNPCMTTCFSVVNLKGSTTLCKYASVFNTNTNLSQLGRSRVFSSAADTHISSAGSTMRSRISRKPARS